MNDMRIIQAPDGRFGGIRIHNDEKDVQLFKIKDESESEKKKSVLSDDIKNAAKYTREDLNNVVRLASKNSRKLPPFIWMSIYKELESRKRISIKQEAEIRRISQIDYIDDYGLIDEAVNIGKSLYGVNYE
jgi:hypothetical protein